MMVESAQLDGLYWYQLNQIAVHIEKTPAAHQEVMQKILIILGETTSASAYLHQLLLEAVLNTDLTFSIRVQPAFIEAFSKKLADFASLPEEEQEQLYQQARSRRQ